MTIVSTCVLLALGVTGVLGTAPSFLNPNGAATQAISETLGAGGAVYSVVFTDSDGDPVTITISSQTPSSPAFTLGVPTVTAVELQSPGGLDAAVAASFDIVFSITDGLSPSPTLSDILTVTITDVNEKPVISPTTYTGTVVETASAGTTVVTITATDPDPTSPNKDISYTITAGDTDTTFAVTATGDITVAGNLDAAGTPSYTLTVQVQDTPGLVADIDATVTITVSVDPCSPNPCQNSGTCASSGASYTCTCTSGWSGTTCNTVDPCSPNPCQNSGTCASSGACTCTSGWSGTTCDTEDSGAGTIHSLTSQWHIYVCVILVILYNMFGTLNA